MQSKGLLKVFSNTTVKKHQFFMLIFLYSSTFTIIHDYYGKTIALTRWTFVGKVMTLLFNMLSRLVITFLPRIWFLVEGKEEEEVKEWRDIKDLNISKL